VPQFAPAFTLNPVVLLAGLQTWHGFCGFTAPGSTHEPPMRQPLQPAHCPFWQEPPAADVQAEPLARSLATHWPCALQVSCPEHSVAGDPQLASVFALKPVALLAGLHTWHGLAGFTAPAAKQVLPTWQP
jgi:hypothetical protein